MKLKVKKIKPLFDYIVTTAHTFTAKEATINGIIDPNLEGKYKPYQEIISIGDMAKMKGLNEGQLVAIDFTKYGKAVQSKNSVNEAIEDYKAKMVYQVPIIELDGKEYLYITSNAIEYIVSDFEWLEDESPVIIEKDKKLIL